jgi:type IV pilus assembly protein PilA
MSACRTSITEVYQSGPNTAPTADGWGCEILSDTQMTKYVQRIHTDDNGVVLATVQGISNSVNGSIIQLVPYSQSGVLATFSTGNSQQLYGWVCGPAATNGVPGKYLPGSCRG